VRVHEPGAEHCRGHPYLPGGPDFLIAHMEDYETAYRDFEWPAFDRFNWARDWFDALAVEQPEVAALTIVEEDGEVNSLTYAEMAERSRQVAGWLTKSGLQPGDRVLIVLGNTLPRVEGIVSAASGPVAGDDPGNHPC